MSEEEVAEIKASLRANAMARRNAIAADFRDDAAVLAAEVFMAKIAPRQGLTISAYWPIGSEIDTRPLLVRLMDLGCAVALPETQGDEPLIMRLWEKDAPLYPSGFGTLAPIETAPVVEPDLVVLPLLGFDRQGNRLGYGKGHYDRTIAAMSRKPTLIGLAFAGQEIDQIPHGAHDIPLDGVVTEAGLRVFERP